MARRSLHTDGGADDEGKAGEGEEREEEKEEDGEEEPEGDEGSEGEAERVVKRKIVIVVSYGGRGDEDGRSPPPSPCRPPELPQLAEVGCQVDGCGADLGEAKRYHRRHRVCEDHAKAAVAPVGGVDQRFCQQCSRFHEISQFDGVKRSCRNRLAGHNERRRKMPADLKANVSEHEIVVHKSVKSR